MSGRQWTWRWAFLPRNLKTWEMSACPHVEATSRRADWLLSECYRLPCSVPGRGAGIFFLLVVHRKDWTEHTRLSLQGQSRGRWLCLADCRGDEATEHVRHRKDPQETRRMGPGRAPEPESDHRCRLLASLFEVNSRTPGTPMLTCKQKNSCHKAK